MKDYLPGRFLILIWQLTNDLCVTFFSERNVPKSPVKNIGKLKLAKAQTGTKYDMMFESLQIPVILIPIFMSSYTNENHHHALNLRAINSRQCTRRIMNLIEQTLLYENKENTNSRSFAMKKTLVPFKEEKCTGNIYDTMLVFTHNIEMNDLNENEVSRNGTEAIVNGVRGVPLTTKEMNELFKILKECMNTYLKGKDPNELSEEITKLGMNILKDKDELKEWEESKNADFLTSCQLLRRLYQKAYKYRLGLIDGAHRATVIFNALYGYKLEEGKINQEKQVPISSWHCSVLYNNEWEIWKYDNSGKKKKIVKIYLVDF